jgi:hypothetical protein
MSRARTWLAVLVALPISIVAIGSMAFTFSELLNPCVVWGASNSGSVYRSADRPCKEGKGVGETRMRAGFEMAAVPGVILLAAVLGVWGTIRSREWIVVLAGCLMILEVFPLVFSFWPLALLAGVGFFWTAHQMPG